MSNRLELDMRALARDLYDRQIAFIFKVPEEMQQTPCDFFGFTRSGRAILIECKQVNRPSLPIGQEPGLAAHQWRALRQAHQCGAIALLVWRRGSLTHVLRYDECEAMAAGRKSIREPGACPDWQKFLAMELQSVPVTSDGHPPSVG